LWGQKDGQRDLSPIRLGSSQLLAPVALCSGVAKSELASEMIMVCPKKKPQKFEIDWAFF
jgi:hypothetical protein